jgi:alkylhydroperoxidase family enzyme
MTNEEIAAREAQVLGAPPRVVPLLRAELSGEAIALIREIGAALGIDWSEDDDSPIAPWFGMMFRYPRLFRLQLETGIHLLGHGAIPPLERELAILRTGWLARAPYEWSEHVRIIRGLGVSEEVVERVRVGSAAPEWSEHERALLRAVEELFADDMISDATWAVLAKGWSELQLIELPALVGQYRAVAGMQNSLRLPLNPDSVGLRAH